MQENRQSRTPPTGDLAHNPVMFHDSELNWWPFSLQHDTQPTEPHQPGQVLILIEPLQLNDKPFEKGYSCVSKHLAKFLEFWLCLKISHILFANIVF